MVHKTYYAQLNQRSHHWINAITLRSLNKQFSREVGRSSVTRFYPRPVLVSGYCRCLRLSVRPSARQSVSHCPACRTTLIATRFRVAVICPIIQVPHCIRVFFDLFDLCLLITFFNFIMNYVPIVTFWIFTYHKIWILSIMFCFIWSYWIIYFLACLEVSWRVVS